MARSDDPNQYSQAWQEGQQPQQGYAPHDPYAQQAPQQLQGHPGGYDTAQQAYAPEPAFAAAPEAYASPPATYHEQPAPAAPQHYAEPQYAQPEAYPPLTAEASNAPAGYGAQDPYAQHVQPEHAAAPQMQADPAPQAYHPAPTQAYDPAIGAQPSPYPHAGETSLQAQAYAPEPVTAPTYADPAPTFADAGQTYADPTQAYADPAPSYAPASDAAPSAQTYAYPAATAGYEAMPSASEYMPEPHAHAPDFAHPASPEPFVADSPVNLDAGFGTPNHYSDPTLGGAHFQAPATTDPAYADFGSQPHPTTQEPAPLDPSLFGRPDDFTQPAAMAGGAMVGAALDHGRQAVPHGGHADFQQQPAYDQRFQAQQQGYDQRFDPHAQMQHGDGLVGEINPQFGQEDPYAHMAHGAEPDMAPVIAEQQVESSRGRRGLIVVGALVAAIGIGGGLGFAYKYSNEGSSTTAGNPPTIKAKRVAAKQQPEATARKQALSSDALARRLQSNRAVSPSKTQLVSREEPLAGSTTSGVSLRSSTSGQTNTNGTQVTSLQGNRVSVNGVRRVQTRTVNPDGTFGGPTLGAGDPLSISGVSLGSVPKAKTVQAKRINVAKAVQQARQRTAPLPKLTRAVPKPTPAAPRKQVARLQAPTPSAVGGSGFVVQVSARRSRIDALAAFADLQQRYTGALSTKQPDIQEVNLGGTRGKWYRVRIGPPGSKNAAYNLCNRLKKSGLKDCLIKAY